MQKTAFCSQLSPIASIPWWVGVGTQVEHVNSSHLSQFDGMDQHEKSGGMLKYHHIMGQAPEKEKDSVIHLDFSAGDNKNSLKGNNMCNNQANGFQQFSPPQQKGCFELGMGQSMVCANYPLADQCQGLFAAYGTQPMIQGRVMLPFSVTTEDGPIYVNPKQYHGILRRRKIRAKEGLQKRPAKDKPYLHESRHRHACRRPRGAGGRFLNTKSLENEKSEHEKKKTSGQQTFPSSQAHSSSSEVLQSESVNFNSPNKVSESKSSTFSGSEVTSMYYSKEFDCFRVSSARPFAFHPLSNMEGSRQGSSWVTATDGCCDFFKV
uniref:Nuclear transcription factor Y subunit n=1 Tax=Opuntia streptacantha TaxID=393608 RepID=A0A7C9E1J2_OPUST